MTPRRVLWWWAAILAVLALLVWSLLPPSRSTFDAKVAELRAAGYAMSLEDSWRDLPSPEENAATEIEAAWNDLVAERGLPRRWGVTGPWDLAAVEPWHETASAEQLAALAGVLEGIPSYFDRIESAATKPALWFRDGRDEDGLPDLRGFFLVKDVHGLLEAQCVANLDPERRLTAAVAALRLAGARTHAFAMPLWFRGTYDDTGLRAARELVERRCLPATEVRGACDALLRGGDPRTVQHAARSQLAWTSEFLDAYLRGKVQICMATPTGPWARSRIVRAWRGITSGHDHSDPSDEDCAADLERERRVAELPRSSLPELHRAVLAIDAGDPEMHSAGDWPERVASHARRDAARALARVALAAAEFREREGHWPDSLAALAPMFPEGVPVDPCDGEPFEMTQADGRVRFTARGRLPGGPPQEDDDDPRAQGLVWEFADR